MEEETTTTDNKKIEFFPGWSIRRCCGTYLITVARIERKEERDVLHGKSPGGGLSVDSPLLS